MMETTEPRFRLIEDVHDRIMAVIPETETVIRGDLEIFISSTWNKAPEVRMGPEVYSPYFYILLNNIENYGRLVEGVDEGWKFEVRDIFAGKK